MSRSMHLASTRLLAAVAVVLLAATLIGSISAIRLEYDDAHLYDPSLMELHAGVRVWSCCRVCPQNHLLEIDQLFGSTPPPVRRYDDPQPEASNFIEEAIKFSQRQRDSNNCCNICPTGQAANAPPQPVSTIPKGSAGVRRDGIRAPLQNLKFSLSRVPLPPCCPYCREQHLDEAFNLVVPPQKKMRPLPYLQRKDLYSGKAVFLEEGVDVEVDAEAESEAEAEAEVDSESQSEMTFKREYTYTSASPDDCCNRCLREPTETEQKVSEGANLWPQNDKKPEDPDAEAAKEEEPGAVEKRLADKEEAAAGDADVAAPAAADDDQAAGQDEPAAN